MPLLSDQLIANTFSLGCRARAMLRPTNGELTVESLAIASDSSLPSLIVGAGSNLLLLDDSLDALVIMPKISGVSIEPFDENEALVVAGAGEGWHQFVMQTLDSGWQGLENLALIPGNVGAAPIQNIGAYGVEVADRIVHVDAYETTSHKLHRFQPEQLQFGYRDSFFKREGKGRFLISSVAFRLSRNAPLNTGYEALRQVLAATPEHLITAKRVAEAVIAVRQSKLPDPVKLGNAGSFFKNPVLDAEVFNALQSRYEQVPNYPQADGRIKLAAGWLIERAGLKGMRRGDAGVHELQALVIVNHGQASGQQLFDVAREVRDTVWQQFSIALEPEVRILNRRAEDVVL